MARLLPLSCSFALLLGVSNAVDMGSEQLSCLVQKATMLWDLPHQASGRPLVFLSFLIILVVRVPKHEQEEYEGDY